VNELVLDNGEQRTFLTDYFYLLFKAGVKNDRKLFF